MSYTLVPREIRQLETLTEVSNEIRSVFVFSHGVDVKFWHANERDSVFKLTEKIDNIPENHLEYVIKYKDVAIIAPEEELTTVQQLPHSVDSRGRPLTHIVPECVKTPNYLFVPIRYEWPDSERFITLLQNLVEAGIPQKMQSEALHRKRAAGVLVAPIRKSIPDVPALSLADFLEPYVLLGIGTVLATLTFLLEEGSASEKRFNLHPFLDKIWNLGQLLQ